MYIYVNVKRWCEVDASPTLFPLASCVSPRLVELEPCSIVVPSLFINRPVAVTFGRYVLSLCPVWRLRGASDSQRRLGLRLRGAPNHAETDMAARAFLVQTARPFVLSIGTA